MTLELPQGRNAKATAVVRVADVDVEAIQSEVPNNCLKALNFIFTACICIGPWIAKIAK